ncbi:hypothetical protein Glove_217g59 [Diversispora epigaea]|uniref:Uncharacterized protein n=1 Tax=Diversispora epigaea TaxID=1348612 RepID=A0A397IR29_9GLOM|nr:hypothetical protein Glove_217g59 [Diversispora epigaea]
MFSKSKKSVDQLLLLAKFGGPLDSTALRAPTPTSEARNSPFSDLGPDPTSSSNTLLSSPSLIKEIFKLNSNDSSRTPQINRNSTSNNPSRPNKPSFKNS